MNTKKATRNDEATRHEEMEISHLAFDLWQRAGRPPGRYIEYCDKAKQRVIAARETPPENSVTVAHPPKTSGPKQARPDSRRVGLD